MEDAYQTRLWGGRFHEPEDALMQRFNGNACETLWLVEPDIQGSLAHVAMQVRCGLLSEAEGRILSEGLNGILADWRSGVLVCGPEYEDVHTFVELNLINRVGEVGKKLHAARSRNDQVNTDMKLYVKAQLKRVSGLIESLCGTLRIVAQKNAWPMPGYTHLQRAQAVTFKYYLLAYAEMFARDKKRVGNALDLLDECPLGCGALAGTTHEIDRAFTAEQLGFAHGPCANFLDGVADRDYVLEALGAFSVLMVHLSRLAEELILWSSAEFGFITLDDRYTTGSSIMPQKKNADGAELIRGQAGRVFGHLTALLCTMKGLPLAYNKDMQEDKTAFHDSLNVVTACLQVMEKMVATLTAHPEAMRAALQKGFVNATEAADYLVRKGMPFRDAHGAVGRLVLYCEQHGKALEDLALEELQAVSPLFEQDVYAQLSYEQILQQGIKKEML